ncbi:MAG TPA: hypothetical protein VE868_12910 [Balneolaceae bacterium]|nr:hypothetical protein [Balneolaceae bacterium]
MNKLSLALAIIVGIVLGIGNNALAQQWNMVSPAIDQTGQPFCYYSHPTDEIGVMNGFDGTMITPKGDIGTGYGTLVFFYGDSLKPVNHRIRTLKKGYLPVVQYHFTKNGISYRVTAFAATLDGNPQSPMMNFIRVTMKNHSLRPETARWAVGTRYSNKLNGLNRGHLPVVPAKPGDYGQDGVNFNSNWNYQFSRDALLRDNDVIYEFSGRPAPQQMMRLPGAAHRTITPDTPVGLVKYAARLAPGDSTSLVFKMPYKPFPANSPLRGKLKKANFSDYLQKTVASWSAIFNKGTHISVPEPKVNHTFRASLVYDLMARDQEKGNYVQKVNDFQYHAFWLRDGSYITRMYDLTGYPQLARQNLDFFGHWQQPNGNFVSQKGQFDGWGEALFVYGQHFRLSHDTSFARKVYPQIQKAVGWLKKARARDPLHLIPKTNPHDNERVSGHITGQNFLALDGLKNIIPIAHALGKPQDAKAFQTAYNDYHSALLKRLKKVTARTHGYIPPALDTYGGDDWGNMMADYPGIVLKPDSPMVTATLMNTRNKYRQGIMTYKSDGYIYMHDYITFKNTETEVIRGEQKMALKELYATLVHTGSTNDGFEYVVAPWKNRDPGGDLAPHGWFAAEYRTLIRNMMVREQGGNLHLFSVLSPDWVKNGQTIKVLRAPTYFGQVNMRLHFSPGKALLTLNNHFLQSNRPDQVILHLPWFMQTESVSADGRSLPVKGGQVVIPAGTRKVLIHWHRKAGAPQLSYKRAVKKYVRKYRKKYYELHPKKAH